MGDDNYISVKINVNLIPTGSNLYAYVVGLLKAGEERLLLLHIFIAR
jgi:hypothetical protein